ncbi:MAG: hypothetical protein ARM1_0098 [Candidatus Micrarchaeota archaeon]|nr:MAG: hypothetical protein ARM1_0098 [Candidatus Micrarchaeota archaeon]
MNASIALVNNVRADTSLVSNSYSKVCLLSNYIPSIISTYNAVAWGINYYIFLCAKPHTTA